MTQFILIAMFRTLIISKTQISVFNFTVKWFTCSSGLGDHISFGNGVIADAIFTNLWAVKVRGNQQEPEKLAHRHGFSYNKHVSFTLVTASLLSPCSMLPFVLATVLCITPSIPQPTTH